MAKILMRVVGTLVGVFGLGMLCFAPFMLYRAITEQNFMMVLLTVLPLAFSAYFIYVFYLAWFRLSPLAVRHICGALGFYVLTLFTKVLDPSRYADRRWATFTFIGCFVIVCLVYRLASERLSKLFFSDSV